MGQSVELRRATHRRLLTVALCLFPVAACLSSGAFAAAPARVWEEDTKIPTYPLGPPSPLPQFGDLKRSGRPFYPYPRLDNAGWVKEDRVWHAVFLENEYLKVMVMPDLGGKLYSIFDKIANREVLYTNHVVKYGMDVGIRGAWTAGGIEWNFPDGHTVTSVSPVDYTLLQDRDGSAAVVVGEIERIQGLQWQVTIRLRPGVRCVETAVVLHNRRAIPGRFWYWANAAAHAAEDLRYVYPMRLAYAFKRDPVYTFPVSDGVDYGLWRSMKGAFELFALNSYRDFIGVYYEKSDWGVVHVADHRVLPGKKLWSWGTDGADSIAQLTDSDGPYVEFQAGRTESQLAHAQMDPYRADRFVEYWYPVNRMGGPWDEATPAGALRLAREHGKIRVTADMNQAFDSADVILEDPRGKSIKTWNTALKPGHPFTAVADVADALQVIPVTARIVSGGHELIRYRSDLPPDGNERFTGKPSAVGAPTSPAAQAYQSARNFDNGSLEAEARSNYQLAAELDRTYLPPRIGLAICYLRSGQYDQADSTLREALRLFPTNPEAHYYAGLLARATNKLVEAKEHLNQAGASAEWAESAREVLGEIAIVQGNWTAASESLALSTGPRARSLFGLAKRLAGNAPRAKSLVAQSRQEMPLDYFTLNEAALLGDAQAESELWRLLDREPDHVLELAFDYTALKRKEARTILEKAISRATPGHSYAMWHYALGAVLDAAGDAAKARAQYQLGARANNTYVFPHRVAEIELLSRALAVIPANTPESGRTSSYLGSALAAQHRLPEAQVQWQAASQADPTNWLPYYLLYRVALAGGSPQSLTYLAQAQHAAPGEYRLYLLLDDALARLPNAAQRRATLWQGAPDPVKQNWEIALRLVRFQLDTGQIKEAEALLTKVSLPDSLAAEAHEGYRQIQLSMAGKLSNAGRHADAAAAMIKALALTPPGSQPAAQPAATVEVARRARPEALLTLVGEFERAGKRNEAQDYLRRAADWPSVPLPESEISIGDDYYRAQALTRLHRFAEAQKLFESVISRDPQGDLGNDAMQTLRHWKASGVIK